MAESQAASGQLYQALCSTYSLALLSIALVCFTTRSYTGLTTTLRSKPTPGAKEPGVLPYWTPWLGHVIPFALGFQTFLAQASKWTTDSVFTLVLGGSKHNMIVSPSVAKVVFAQRTALSVEDFTARIMRTFFGDEGALATMDPATVHGPIGRQLYGMMREPWLSTALGETVKGLEQRTYNLISFSRSPVDQSVWERSAGVSGPAPDGSATASFHPLIQNFVGDLACRVLMGHNFMENNPDVLDDLWTWDAQFNLFFVGLPRWLPGMSQAARARSRLVEMMREFHGANFQTLDGEDPGPRWADMSDVSSVMVDRAREWKAAHAPAAAYAAGDLAVLWAMNVNANQVIFWLLWHVYSDAALLRDLRAEMQACIRVEHRDSGLKIQEAPRMTIDMDGLFKQCPLLKSTIYEVMRINVPSTTYKSIVEDFTATESPEDAHIHGRSEPQTYQFRKGHMLCVPHGVHQADERYFKDPTVFDARRFMTVDEKTHAVTVDMGTMRVWGGGATMCKGRNFAEREVVVFGAAVLSQWDVVPESGRWEHPGHKLGAGTVQPKKDIRVRLTRRPLLNRAERSASGGELDR